MYTIFFYEPKSYEDNVFYILKKSEQGSVANFTYPVWTDIFQNKSDFTFQIECTAIYQVNLSNLIFI